MKQKALLPALAAMPISPAFGQVSNEVTLADLNTQLQNNIAAGRKITNLAQTESRDLTAEEITNLDGINSTINSLKAQIRQMEQDADAQEVNNRLSQPTTPAITADPANNGLSRGEQRDLSSYSLLNVIRSAVNGQQLTGIEAEMHQEAQREAQNSGRVINGLGIPEMILHHRSQPQNANLTTGAGTGGEFVETRNGSIIDALRSHLTLTSLGATYLSDLRGNVEFPTVADGATPSEKAENATADDATPTTSSVALNPQRLPAYMNLSRSLIAQSSSDVEAWVRNYLASLLAEGQERYAIAKVLGTAGIGSVAFGGAPTHEKLVALKAAVRGAKANRGSLGFLTNTDVQSKCETVKIDAGSGKFLLEAGSTMLCGAKAEFTDLVPNDGGVGSDESSIIYGNWSDLFLGQWGGLDLIVNPYSGDREGLVRITATTLHEALVSRPASFAKGTGITTVLA